MSKEDRTVRDLVGMVERGELRLPEMQREYVWKAPRVRDLLDSLYRGYPSGVILAWQSDEEIATRDFAVGTSAPSGYRPLLLLDGQQRLTSLSSVLRGEPVQVRGRKRPIEILFNLDHPDELTFVTEVNEQADHDLPEADEGPADIQERLRKLAFVIGTRALEGAQNWVRVTEIFRHEAIEILEDKGFDIATMDRGLRRKYMDRLRAVRAIENYEYRMDVLERSKSYEEVTEIFVRVNSLGAKLRSSDLALAQITAKWRGSLELFEEYRKSVDTAGFNLDLSLALRTLMAIATGQSKFQSVSSLSLSQLQQSWEQAKKAFDFALNFCQSNLRIDSPVLLSSPFLLITTAYWAHRLNYDISPDAAKSFKKWFLIANAKGRYSRGSSETLLDQDLVILRNGGGGDELMTRLTQQVGRLDFTVDELIGRTARSGFFKTMFLAFREDDARDWGTNLAISPKHQGKSDAIEYHHIFPKAFLRKVRPELERSGVDDLANLAFIGASTNKRIRDRAPSAYRSEFDESDLRNQLVDFSDGRDEPNAYERFITARREALAERINRFLGVASTQNPGLP